MAVKKGITQGSNVVWSFNLRPKVNSTVTFNGVEYINLTGSNSEPSEDSNDWRVFSESVESDSSNSEGVLQTERTVPLENDNDYSSELPFSEEEDILVSSNVDVDLSSGIVNLNGIGSIEALNLINRPEDEFLLARFVHVESEEEAFLFLSNNPSIFSEESNILIIEGGGSSTGSSESFSFMDEDTNPLPLDGAFSGGPGYDFHSVSFVNRRPLTTEEYHIANFDRWKRENNSFSVRAVGGGVTFDESGALILGGVLNRNISINTSGFNFLLFNNLGDFWSFQNRDFFVSAQAYGVSVERNLGFSSDGTITIDSISVNDEVRLTNSNSGGIVLNANEIDSEGNNTGQKINLLFTVNGNAFRYDSFGEEEVSFLSEFDVPHIKEVLRLIKGDHSDEISGDVTTTSSATGAVLTGQYTRSNGMIYLRLFFSGEANFSALSSSSQIHTLSENLFPDINGSDSKVYFTINSLRNENYLAELSGDGEIYISVPGSVSIIESVVDLNNDVYFATFSYKAKN